jgi:hypothetical protein
MADRARWFYVVRVVITCWMAIAGVGGILVGIFYLCRGNATLTIIVSQLVIYSGVFGFMAWQQYKWSDRRKNWQRGGERWERLIGKTRDREEAEDPEDGWK